MESIEILRAVGLVMLCSSLALVETLLLHQTVWGRMTASMDTNRKSSLSTAMIVLIEFVGGMSAVLFAWMVWRAIAPPVLGPALISVLVFNGLFTHIGISAYRRYRNRDRVCY